MNRKNDAYQALRELRKDLSHAQARVTDALNALNALGITEDECEPCPGCGCLERHTFSCPVAGYDATTEVGGTWPSRLY